MVALGSRIKKSGPNRTEEGNNDGGIGMRSEVSDSDLGPSEIRPSESNLQPKSESDSIRVGWSDRIGCLSYSTVQSRKEL